MQHSRNLRFPKSRAMQKMLKRPAKPVTHLVPHSLKTLRAMLKELEAELMQVAP
jgi:hypothetical protein